MVANIENFKELLKNAEGDKNAMQKAFERISQYLASSILGRDFNESTESYFNRKTTIKMIHDWAAKVTISNDYKIINY